MRQRGREGQGRAGVCRGVVWRMMVVAGGLEREQQSAEGFWQLVGHAQESSPTHPCSFTPSLAAEQMALASACTSDLRPRTAVAQQLSPQSGIGDCGPCKALHLTLMYGRARRCCIVVPLTLAPTPVASPHAPPAGAWVVQAGVDGHGQQLAVADLQGRGWRGGMPPEGRARSPPPHACDQSGLQARGQGPPTSTQPMCPPSRLLLRACVG